MQNSVAKAGTVASPTHPLDPLTPDEIRRAAAAVRSGARSRARHDVRDHQLARTGQERGARLAKPGEAFAREAFVCAFDRTNGKVCEARVDLVADRVVDWRHVPGVRPRILIDDINAGGRSGPSRSAVPGGAGQARHYRHRESSGRSLVGRQLRSAGRGRPPALAYVLLVPEREERQRLCPSDRGALRRDRSRPRRGSAHRRLWRGRRPDAEPQLRGTLPHRLPRRRKAAGDRAAGRARASPSKATRCAGRSGAPRRLQCARGAGAACRRLRGWRHGCGRCCTARRCRKWSCLTDIPAADISARTPSMSASTASACWRTR